MKKIHLLLIAFLCSFAIIAQERSLEIGGTTVPLEENREYKLVPDAENIKFFENSEEINVFKMPVEINFLTNNNYQIMVKGVTLNHTVLGLQINSTINLIATIDPENATNQIVTWTSSNESVATIDNTGKVTVLSQGTATLTVTTHDGNHTATCELTVSPVAVTDIEISYNSLVLGRTESFSLFVTIFPEDATNKDVIWTSSNTNIVTVDNNGNITALNTGSAIITATTVDGNYTASCDVLVITVSVSSVALSSTTLEIEKDNSTTLTATISPRNALNKNISWNSSDEAVATVNNEGVVTAIKEGVTTITVTTEDGNHKATCVVTVFVKSVTDITISQTTLEIEKGASETLQVTILPEDATNKNITWTSSDENIATVDSEGNVTTISVGTVTITATTEDGGHTATCIVTVFVKSVTNITISQSTLEIGLEASEALQATVFPEDATNKNIIWTSSDENIATVDSDGNVTAISLGTTTITATTEDGGFSASCVVSVIIIPVTDITISQSTLEIEKGESETLQVTVLPEDATNKNVFWTSSDENIATVDSNGGITTIEVGTVTITATTEDGGYTAICQITVKPIAVTGITISQTALEIGQGASETLQATISPENAANKNIIWTSSDENIATVDSNGKITAIEVGTATITATTEDEGHTATCEVTVIFISIEDIYISHTSLEIGKGTTIQLQATILPENASNKTVIWSSSDESIATVDSDGIVTAVEVGTITIIATTEDGGLTTTCQVKVFYDAVDDIHISHTLLEIGKGETKQLQATVLPESATNKNITWSSSDENIATVDNQGNVTAINVGVVSITATTVDGGFEASCVVTVIVIPVTDIIISQTTLEIEKGELETLQTTIIPENAYNKTVLWSSSDESIVTVNADGLVTAVEVGIATITATTEDGGHTATCQVTVVNITVKGIEILPNYVEIGVNNTKTMQAILFPDDAYNKNVTWSSSNQIIATVDEDGIVTAKNVGQATITAITEDGNHKATCEVTVFKKAVEGISIDATLELKRGESEILEATVLPADASNKLIIWKSSYKYVATVDNNGKVTAVNAGTATITATTVEGGFEATCKVTVSTVAVTNISLSDATLEIKKGESETLEATILPEDASNKKIIWTSSNPSVATVDDNGIVTALEVGTSTITATTDDGGLQKTCEVTVFTTPVTSVAISDATLEIEKGESEALQVTVLPENTSNKKIIWTTSNEFVATVDNNGNVIAIDAGTCTITATSEDGGITAECDVTVYLMHNGLRYGGVINPVTGKTWLDRNLGASQVATSIDDELSFGDLYQWGRGTDGHEKRTSATTSTLSDSDTPGHGDFITTNSAPKDWRNPQNDNLWQGVDGINNPCPDGYRIPTKAEFDNELQSWSTQDLEGAFNSPLKISEAGSRNTNGGVYSLSANLWSSNLNGTSAYSLYVDDSNSSSNMSDSRASANSVRCIRYEESVTSISLNESYANLEITKEMHLIATVLPEDAHNKNVIWTSSDETIATVDNNGNVTSVNVGIVTITATTVNGNFDAICDISVFMIPSTGLSISKTSLELEKGETAILVATVTPEEATYKNVIWASLDEDVATIDSDGVITPVEIGKTRITATTEDGSFTEYCEVTILPVSGTYIDKRDNNEYKWITLGEQTWLAENMKYLPSVNKVSESSLIKPMYYVYGYDGNEVNEAKATDNYKTYGTLYNWSAALKACPEGWHLPNEDEWQELIDFAGGGSTASRKLKSDTGWSVNDINGTNDYGFSVLPAGEIYYSSFYYLHEYASFWLAEEYSSAYGLYSYIGEDYEGVNVENYEKSHATSVRCIKGEVPIIHLSLNENEYIESGTTKTLELNIYPLTAANRQFIWVSSDESIATVDNTGKVTAISTGFVTISASTKDYSHSAVCEVEVYELSGTFTDEEGNEYDWVRIGKQSWMTEDIGEYKWEEALEACPKGWHLPSDKEWGELIDFAGGATVAGGKLKSTTGWYDNGNGTDDYGFNAKGYIQANFWTSDNYETDNNRARYYKLVDDSNVIQAYAGGNIMLELQVRCIRGTILVDEIKLNTQKTYIGKQQSKTLEVKLLPKNAENKSDYTSLTWSSSNSAIATVDENGAVTGKKVGVTTITVTSADGTLSANCEVEVLESFVDERDGNIYKTVQIGEKTWLAENMKYLPSVNKVSESSENNEMYYVYGYDGKDEEAAKATDNHNTYGALYNWEAALKACPDGWHLPDEDEWQELIDFAGGGSIAAEKLKSDTYWTVNDNNGTDDYGLSVLPAGENYYSSFAFLHEHASFWTADMTSPWGAFCFSIGDNVYSYDDYIAKGLSVRCIEGEVAVKSITLSTTAQQMIEGEEFALKYIIRPANASNREVTWSSSNEAVATVDSNGKVTAIAGGVVTITVTTIDGNYTANCEITVIDSANVIMHNGLVYLPITNPTTGRIWLDRNLGASQVATNIYDELSFGDLYQWGRGTDGHEKRNSETTTTLSNSDTPGHSDFIIVDAYPYDWRDPKNDNLWQGVSGINNPCPAGYRIPTEAEWVEEYDSWSSFDELNAHLKITLAGYKLNSGSLYAEYNFGYYWSSTASYAQSTCIKFFNSLYADEIGDSYRNNGLSIRCIKEEFVSVSYVSLSENFVAVPAGQSAELSATVTPTNATDKTVLWSSSNEAVATVDSNGKVTAIAVGVATITVTTIDGGYTANCEITVIDNTNVIMHNGLVYLPITNPTTGRTWLDRNLGATQVATSSTDELAYGDLYQWGRGTDGHEKRTSGTTTVLSNSDTPGHGDFITNDNSPYDWRNPQNDNLWQGVNGINNPCPAEYRVPTEAEWVEEYESWSGFDDFNAQFKMPLSGGKLYDGSFFRVDSYSYYWSSTVSGNEIKYMYFHNALDVSNLYPVYGLSVRCIKD